MYASPYRQRTPNAPRLAATASIPEEFARERLACTLLKALAEVWDIMTRPEDIEKDTPAWLFQVWASFAIATGTTIIGIAYLPLDIWLRAFLWMGLTFSIGSSFTLAKTLRDNHEAKRKEERLAEAKTERIMRDLEINKTGPRADG